ncbi:hypothetical protein V5O48_001830 [Marasmius crinis-equi]|uniref:F-box domain-containing protein n=1 Tax=Marasmius crinis-equi TaxID=585013 RepID=A0ABR3FYH0_9AGAR
MDVGLELELGIPTPMVLTSVSSRWRSVAISSQTLWSSLALEVSSIPYEYSCGDNEARDAKAEEVKERCHKMAELYMNRANNAPLSLSFKDLSDGTDTLAIDMALDSLCRRAHQWQSLVLEIQTDFLDKHRAFRIVRGELTNLREVTFFVEGASEARMMRFLGYCPSLRSVRYELVVDSVPRPPGNLHTTLWSQLESLSLFVWDHDMRPDVLRIVELCTNLAHLHIEFPQRKGSSYINPAAPESHTHCTSNVKSLCLETNGPSEVAVFDGFLPYITTPNLDTLRLRGHPGIPGDSFVEDDEKHLLAFVQRSACTITSLSLFYADLHEEALVQLFRLLPNVTRLSIHDRIPPLGFNTKRLFKHVLANPQKSEERSLLPHLRHLNLQMHCGRTDYDAFVEAMKCRCLPDIEPSTKVGVDSIRSLLINFIDRTEKVVSESFQSLDEFKRAGLEVCIEDTKCESGLNTSYRGIVGVLSILDLLPSTQEEPAFT